MHGVRKDHPSWWERVREVARIAWFAARLEWLRSSPPSPCDMCLDLTVDEQILEAWRITRRCVRCQVADGEVRFARMQREAATGAR